MVNSRDKGKRGEREFAEKLREHGYGDARRGQQFAGGGDSPDVVGVPGVHFEVKYGGRVDFFAALAQATRDHKAGTVPVVAGRLVSRKKTGNPWIIALRLEDFLVLLRAEPRSAAEPSCESSSDRRSAQERQGQ